MAVTLETHLTRPDAVPSRSRHLPPPVSCFLTTGLPLLPPACSFTAHHHSSCAPRLNRAATEANFKASAPVGVIFGPATISSASGNQSHTLGCCPRVNPRIILVLAPSWFVFVVLQPTSKHSFSKKKMASSNIKWLVIIGVRGRTKCKQATENPAT